MICDCPTSALLGTAALVSILFPLGEILSRIWASVPLACTDNFIAETRGARGLRHDPVVGWRLRDGYRSDGFTVGDHGARTTNPVPPDTGGPIVVVGDSFTVGPGLRDEETWPACLERALDRPVINLACGGYGVDQMTLRAEEALARHPDAGALVVAMLDLDGLRNGYVSYGGRKPWFALDDEGDGLTLEGSPVPWHDGTRLSLETWRRILGHSHLLHTLFMSRGGRDIWLGDDQFARVHDDATSVEISRRLMVRLAGIGRDRGIPVIPVILYGAGACALPPAWYATAVSEAAVAAGLNAIDMHAALNRLFLEAPDRFVALWQRPEGTVATPALSQLGYPSPEGAAFIAERVAGAIAGDASPS